MLPEDLKEQLISRLKEINPLKVILFGSYACGTPDGNSDIDLLVVTKDDFIPKNFSEKKVVYLQVSNRITDIEKKVPIDLIVHTKTMHQKFIQLGSIFARKIAVEGVILYESPD
ncbi:MAG: nucleotidyltransferase domain-containing protein [Thermodesulfobacteriota bacterium]